MTVNPASLVVVTRTPEIAVVQDPDWDFHTKQSVMLLFYIILVGDGTKVLWSWFVDNRKII